MEIRPGHHTQTEEGQGRNEVNEGRYGLHQIEHRTHHGVEHRFVRGDDAQRHADDHADQGGEQHLGEGFHGFLPVPQIEDQQEGGDDENGQSPFALNEVREQGDQADQDQRVEPGQRKRHAVDHRFQCHGDCVEGVGAVLRQPFNEARDVLA